MNSICLVKRYGMIPTKTQRVESTSVWCCSSFRPSLSLSHVSTLLLDSLPYVSCFPHVSSIGRGTSKTKRLVFSKFLHCQSCCRTLYFFPFSLYFAKNCCQRTVTIYLHPLVVAKASLPKKTKVILKLQRNAFLISIKRR